MTWEHFCDVGYYDMWCVRPVGERRFGCGFHLMHEEEAVGLAELLSQNAVANPWTALAAGSRRAKTPKAVECEASQSGPKGNAQSLSSQDTP